MAFTVGSVVKLKGGSPIMTVTSIGKDRDGSPRLTCTWFDGGKEQTGVYPPEALMAYGERSSGGGDDGDWMSR